MNKIALALAATLASGGAYAQTPPRANTTPAPAVTTPGAPVAPPPSANTTPTDGNPAVATTGANATQPARGHNSFTAGEARRRIERNGFTTVADLKKDNMGVWRGNAMKDGTKVGVWLDYKGNVGQQ